MSCSWLTARLTAVHHGGDRQGEEGMDAPSSDVQKLELAFFPTKLHFFWFSFKILFTHLTRRETERDHK